MIEFELEPRGPFRLASAARFIAGWLPAGQPGAAADGEAVVRLGFLVDDWSGHAGVVLRQDDADGPVRISVVESTASDPARVRDQAARIVSLDHDGIGYAALGEREAAIGRLQRASDWLRPVIFHSPYEAACWAVISARIRQVAAGRVRDELSVEHGGRVTIEGEELLTFPSPERLLAVTDVPGLSDEKVRRLHGVARAALEGHLDRERLLALDPDRALDELRELRGIGPFWAEGILLRAVGTTDVLTLAEKQSRKRAAELYGAPEIVEDDDALVALAERWRPFRTWVTVLLRAAG